MAWLALGEKQFAGLESLAHGAGSQRAQFSAERPENNAVPSRTATRSKR